MSPLTYRIEIPVGSEETLGSPEIASHSPGLQIAVDHVSARPTAVRFRLLVSFGFPDDYYSSFKHIGDALVAVLRDGASGRSAAFRLEDPTVNYLEPPFPAFVDGRRARPSIIFASGYRNVPIDVDIAPAANHPGLFVHVALHEHLSNVVVVPVAAEVSS